MKKILKKNIDVLIVFGLAAAIGYRVIELNEFDSKNKKIDLILRESKVPESKIPFIKSVLTKGENCTNLTERLQSPCVDAQIALQDQGYIP